MLFGWQLGIWLALTYFFCYKDWIQDTLGQLIKRKGNQVRGLVLWGVILFVLTTSLETTNYLVVVPEIDLLPEWAVNIVAKCPDAPLDEAF